MPQFNTAHAMIPIFLLFFSSCSRSTIIGDRLDYRRMNLSSIPDENVKENEAKSITKLIFSHNAIEYLQQSDFERLETFPNTRYLFLDNNKIEEIYEDGFSNLRNLKHLDLSHNELKNIPDNLKRDLLKLPSLIYINLKRNPIENFESLYELIEAGIDVDFDGMSGVNRKRREKDVLKDNDHEILDHDHENKTSTDKPRKAFVVDNKPRLTPKEETDQMNSKFRNSIIFNFVAAGLVLVALPMGMIVYYLVNKSRRLYS